jgi:prepilin-type N-terminal cleavage/methylation domain-containing protein
VYTKLKIKNYKITKLKAKAFTLIELLVVIGITAILAGVGVSSYSGQQRAKLLDNTTQEIVGYLRYAQQKSMAQEEGKQWGVHFENPASGNDFYALYSGASYTSPAETRYLPKGLEFQLPSTGNTVNISFSKLSGVNSSQTEQEVIINHNTIQIARVIRTMSNGLITSGEGEKGYWKFDDGSGNFASDSTIYKNTGTLVNSPTWKSGSDCISGSCLSFNGSNQYINLDNPVSLQITGNQTIEMWLKPASLDARRNPYAKAYGGEGTITQETNGSLNYYYGIAGGNTTPYQGFGSGAGTVSIGTWSYVAIVRDLTNMKLRWYKNGNLLNEVGASYAAAATSSLNACIGAGYVSNYSGLIDEVRIYNRALSAAEIQEHYKARK